jgi:hypothetical protein
VKDADVANILAVLGDAEARSTAMLVELVAAAALVKLNPPEGDAVVMLEIGQADLSEAGKDFFWRAEYDEHGTMRLYLTRNVDSLIATQPSEDVEVTSDTTA